MFASPDPDPSFFLRIRLQSYSNLCIIHYLHVKIDAHFRILLLIKCYCYKNREKVQRRLFLNQFYHVKVGSGSDPLKIPYPSSLRKVFIQGILNVQHTNIYS